MRVGISVSDPEDWTVKALRSAFIGQGTEVFLLDLSRLAVEVAEDQIFRSGALDLLDLDGLVIRDMGRGQPQDVAFRFEFLSSLSASGLTVVNSPRAILSAANKLATTLALKRAHVATPKTTVTNSLEEAVRAIEDYGRAVSKPLFGYKGRDLVLLTKEDPAPLEEILKRTGIVYLQEFVAAPGRDIRAFVVGNVVAGAIYRFAPPGSWISNLARGGRPEPCRITEELEDLALRASAAVGAFYSGVDLLESPEGLKVIEVNGTPSGKGIYSATGVDVGEKIARGFLMMLRQ